MVKCKKTYYFESHGNYAIKSKNIFVHYLAGEKKNLRAVLVIHNNSFNVKQLLPSFEARAYNGDTTQKGYILNN